MASTGIVYQLMHDSKLLHKVYSHTVLTKTTDQAAETLTVSI